MAFGEPKFENPAERKIMKTEEEAEEREKMTGFIKEIAQNLQEEGVPVTDDCRIDMGAFRKIYPEAEIEADRKKLEDYQKEWLKEKGQEGLKTKGEKLEMLKTAIFSKFLGKDFIVARTSLHDDVKNNIDNIVLEKETGNLVCALDEVGESSGPGYEEKKRKVLDRNRRQDGGTLKYGFLLEKGENGENKLNLSRVRNIPLFYLALPDDFVKKGIQELILSLESSSDYEKNLFSYFIESLSAQVKFFQLGRESLNPALKDRLKHFEKTVKKFK